MPYYTLSYAFVEDYLARRVPLRDQHLAYVRGYRTPEVADAPGARLVLAGAYEDVTDGALLIFEADGPAAVVEFAEEDPYVLAGLVTQRWIRRWNVVE